MTDPQNNSHIAFSNFFKPTLKLMLAVIVPTLLILSFFRIQSVLERLSGSQLKVANSIYYSTYQKTDRTIPIKFELLNQGATPVIFLGFSNSCSCTLVDEIPPTIPPFKPMTLSGYVQRDPENPSLEFKGNIRLFTNIPSQPEVFLSYHLIDEGGSLKMK